MDKDLYKFLRELKFNDHEVEFLLSVAPALEEITVSTAIQNMTLVVNAGYPADDIGYLISQNPAFLCRNSTDLRQDLIKLTHACDDIESALKDDPFLI